MTPFAIAQFTAGVLFTAACMVFLWKCFDAMRHGATEGQLDIVHFVCSLCAGAAGAFFTGTALLSFETQLTGGGKLAFQGAAGVALFGLVFLVLRLFRRRNETLPPGEPTKTIAPGTQTPFHQVAHTLADEAGGSIDLSGLSPTERDVVPRSESLRCATLEQTKRSLERLAELVPPGSVRPYKVHLDDKGKRFTLQF